MFFKKGVLRLKRLLFFIFALLLVNTVFACVELEKGAVYQNSSDVCNDVFFLDKGITIHGDDIVFDCNNAVIRGYFFENSGISVINSRNVTINNCNIMFYKVGINVQNSKSVILKENRLIKNLFGTKFFNSEDNFVYGADISLTQPVKVAASKNNFIHYFNKRIEEHLCPDSECNKDFAVSEERRFLNYSPTFLFWTSPFVK